MDKACDDGRCGALEWKAQLAECERMVQPLVHISH